LRATCRRLGDGQAIRDAMGASQLNLTRLAERTRELDPDGKGVSYQLIGFLTAQGRSKRDTASPRSAALIAQALGRPQDALFEASCTAMRRADGGQPLRGAMAERNTVAERLARRTRKLDPRKRGVAEDVIEKLADPDEQEPPVIAQRAAALIAKALDCPENDLFKPADSAVPESSAKSRH
jgi:hypothetical protein